MRTIQQCRANITLAVKRAAKLGGRWNYLMNTSMISKSFESKNTASPAQSKIFPERHKRCRSSTAEASCFNSEGMSSGCVLNMEEQLLDQDRRSKVDDPWVNMLLLSNKALDLAAPRWEANTGQGCSLEDVKQAEKRWEWKDLLCCSWDYWWHGRKSGGNTKAPPQAVAEETSSTFYVTCRVIAILWLHGGLLTCVASCFIRT